MHSPTFTATKWWPGDSEYPSTPPALSVPKEKKSGSGVALALRSARPQADSLF